MGVWRIEMFGGLRASCGAQTIDRFPTQKTAALFAYLALHPHTSHSREVLAELFWPDADPGSQRHSLRLALSRLRTLFGTDHPLEADRSVVRLNPERFVTDVAEFEGAAARGDARTAKRLASGPLLPGHYDEWVVAEQVRLETLAEAISENENAVPDTLPKGLDRLFGRSEERSALTRLLRTRKLVTLTAPGGMGKTRLAVAITKELERAVWVSLADLDDPVQAADAIRSALRLPVPAPGFAVSELIYRELADLAPLVLILDNADQLVGEELRNLARALASIGGIKLLVTSRQLLGMPEETEFPLGPLPEVDAIALFEQRAKRARPDLVTDAESTKSLARRLGGIPLALELAAARAGVQGLAQLEEAAWTSDGDFGESLGIPERQRSLDAVLGSSLALLPPKTAAAFARLGVFRGGFDAAGAEAVGGANLATLETLRRWSLITPAEQTDGTLRFRMPEPFRNLTRDRREGAEQAHARYFAHWVESNRADDLPPPPREFGQRLALQERERDNIRTALETCRTSDDPADRELGLRIVAAFWTHWYVRNAGSEMEEWARSLLDGPGEQADLLVQASARLSLSLAIRERGAREEAAQEVERALTVLRSGPRDRNQALAWHLRGLTLGDLARYEEAESAYLESEAIWMEFGDLRNFSISRHNRGMLAADRGELDTAEKLVGEAMEIFRDHRSTYVAIAHATQGTIRRARGDFAGAAAAFRASSDAHRTLGYVRGWAQTDRDLALCLFALGRADEARLLAEDALRSFRRVGDRHGEATTLSALSRITGEPWHADEARGILARHGLPAVGELLEGLRRS